MTDTRALLQRTADLAVQEAREQAARGLVRAVEEEDPAPGELEPDLVITAQDCGSYKPAPGHWRMFAERSGAGPDDTIHVGASQYHDIRAAAALGYRTVFVDRHGEKLDTAPTRVTSDLATLPDVIDALE